MLHINTSTRTKCLTCHMSRFLAVCRTALYVVLHCEDHIQTITTTSSDLACLDLFPLVNSSTLNFFSIPCQLPCMLILYVTHSCLTLYKPKTRAYGTALGRSFGAGHSSPGASPLDPLVRMFNPSSHTHAKSQLLCSISLNCFIFFKQHK